MGGMLARLGEAVRARARTAFSRTNLAWAASGAAIAVVTLAAGSIFALRGFVYLNPAGVVLYAPMGAALSLVLRECFLVVRAAPGVGLRLVQGSALAVVSGVLWILLTAGFVPVLGEGPKRIESSDLVLLALSGALVALWMEAPGPRAGLFHSLLKSVACTWLVLLLCFVAVVGPAGQVVRMDGSIALMRTNLWMAWFVGTALLTLYSPFLLPPLMGVATWLWFRGRARPAAPAAAAVSAPMEVPPAPSRTSPPDGICFRPAVA